MNCQLMDLEEGLGMSLLGDCQGIYTCMSVEMDITSLEMGIVPMSSGEKVSRR